MKMPCGSSLPGISERRSKASGEARAKTAVKQRSQRTGARTLAFSLSEKENTALYGEKK